MAHIVLLGDSIFDNKVYVGDEPDVVSHLRAVIPQDWQATLKAVDGSLVENVGGQVAEIPTDATHLFVSAGGNDALMNADILGTKASSAADIFNDLYNRIHSFEIQYRRMLEMVSSQTLPITVCTIYYPNFSDYSFQKIATAALSAFNDAIIKQAILSRIPLIDLRLVCNEKDDYANDIEPSGKGAKKIAAKIFEIVKNHDFSTGRTSVYY